MGSKKSSRAQLVRDTVRRFHHLPDRTIARHLVNNYPGLFQNKEGEVSLEIARSAVRYVTGKKGELKRSESSRELFKDFDRPILPSTWKKEQPPFELPNGIWLILNDVHIPFHEAKALEAAIQWGQANNVDGVFLNGDIQDCHAVSFWPTASRDFDR